MEPFLKAVGGKRWISTKLADEIMATNPNLYVEPFVGGGAVTLALPPSIPKIVSDINSGYIAVWLALKSYKPEEMLAAIADVQREYPNTAFGYARARDALNGYLAAKDNTGVIKLAALVLYINTRCFNGIWRVNQSGEFNVPWNKTNNPRRFSIGELKSYHEALVSVAIMDSDFRSTLDIVGNRELPKTAIYIDSPYDETFDGYASGGFDEVDQRDLAKWLRWLSARGAKVWATNADTPLIRELYSGWAKIEVIDEYHSVGAKANRRGQRQCLLIRA